MGLKGQLEDLPLIDMLQIIAFSKKSGYLRIAGPAGRGAVVLSDGRVLFAFSWSTMARLRELAHDPDQISLASNRENIEAAIRELAGLREGSFRFELTSEISDDLGGVRIKPFMIPGGIDPQELLLDLAVEIDNERRVATTLLELAFQGEPPEEEIAAVEADAPLTPESIPGPTSSAPLTLPATPRPELRPPARVAEVTSTSREAQAHSSADNGGKAAAEPAALDASHHTIVLVDDEPPVTDVVGSELKSRGYTVFTASSPASAAELILARAQQGESILAAVDLKMPTSSGESFYGGFELIRRLRSERLQVPVLLMAESLSDAARDQAKALAVRRIVYKPALTKPDPELYRADLKDFADSVETQLRNLVADQRDNGDNGGVAARAIVADSHNGSLSSRTDFISAMTKKLVEPGGSNDVSLLVMQVATRFLERGVLFVVKSVTARGLAGFGFGSSEKHCADVTRGISLSIDDSESLTEVVSTGKTLRLRQGLAELGSDLVDAIGCGNATEGVLMPMLYNRATLLLLYGDNGMAGRPLGDLSGLELFMAQAGMALENKLLQRKLSGEHPALGSVEQGVQ